MKYPHLFSPITLGNVTYRNRIFAAPTGSPMVIPGEYLNRECRAFYELRAKGGAAVVSLGDGIVHTPTGLMHPHKLRFDDERIVPSLSATARAITRHGAVASAELSHGGKYANISNFVSKTTKTGMPPYGPDHEFTADGVEILEMPEEIIDTIVNSYGCAAARAKMCGFGHIIIHGGHGWLLHQFMSPTTNHRKDRFGGSRENRCRLSLMVIDSVRRAVGSGFPIEFRMSGAEFINGGYDLDEGIEIAKILASKIDLLHISAGVHDDEDSCVITHPSMFEAHGRNVYLAEKIKKFVDCPVATIGALNDPEEMEEIIASGKADVIEISRGLIADPFLPFKAASGQEHKIVKCIRCFQCLDQTATKRNIRCTVNPIIGAEIEHEYPAPVASYIKKVLVVGGGPAGMETALQAARKGHDVTICDKNDKLGGHLLCEEFIPFKKELYMWTVQKQAELADAGVKILCGNKVDRKWAEKFGADVIVCAAGSAPNNLHLPCAEKQTVLNFDDLKRPDLVFGKFVVIIGGGLVGCETGVHLLLQGKKVTIVHCHEDYAADATLWHKQALRQQLQGKAEIRLNTSVVEITESGVIVQKDGVREEIKADTVFNASGLEPRIDMRNELRGITAEYYEIGDCLKPGLMFDAVSQGHFIGREI